MDTPSEDVSTIMSQVFRDFYSSAFQPIVDTGTRTSIGLAFLLRGPAGALLAEPERQFMPAGSRDVRSLFGGRRQRR